MRSLRILICGSEDLAADLLTDLATVEVPLPDLATLRPATVLDETATFRCAARSPIAADDTRSLSQHQERFRLLSGPIGVTAPAREAAL